MRKDSRATQECPICHKTGIKSLKAHMTFSHKEQIDLLQEQVEKQITDRLHEKTTIPDIKVAKRHSFSFIRKKAKATEKPNCLVLDQTHSRKLEFIPEPQGRQWLYNGRYIHLMKRDRNGTLEVVEPPDKLGQLPELLYRAINPQEVSILFALPTPLLEKIGTFALYVLIGVLILFIIILRG